jgi:ribonuclease E
MLIDGNHPEEIRVVMLNGNRLEDYDIETSTKTQLKGNIYLAKVTRVEPSLQAAFVDYGGNRHGFLAFNEIHPDYYQIPIEDREALKRDMALFAGNAQAAQAHVDEMDDDVVESPVARVPSADGGEGGAAAAATASMDSVTDDRSAEADESDDGEDRPGDDEDRHDEAAGATDADETAEPDDPSDANETAESVSEPDEPAVGESTPAPVPSEGGRRRRPVRRYRIQEVIKRRQILLVQVVKEERGNKGAALTTYLSLAGRYCVLMPNAARVGGVSRKITSATDRRRLRDLLNSLEVPEGMGVIMRTAGMERTKAEIKRDLDYLLRLWEDVRELTLNSTAPALVYEEGDLIKRAIRDLYARDIEEVLVEGKDAYETAKKFMRLMMPSHAKRVKQYRDPTIPLFHRYQVEPQLEAMHSPVVQLKSGGYIVINPTEALVAVDVNSGRATRERNIEETATKTNLEAAAEIARQLRLRDLAGLIVIDFIDMEEGRNQRAVEKRVKESVKNDRARIQLGRISTFGLFELSRQRLRPSLLETSTEACPRCHGIGFVRSTESTAIRVLRALEEEGIRRRTAEVTIEVATPIALYILNQKRSWLADIERRYGFTVTVTGDDSLVPPEMRLERTRARTEADDAERPIAVAQPEEPVEPEVEDADETGAEEEAAAAAPRDSGEARDGTRRKRRRRRRKDGTVEPRENGTAEPREPSRRAPSQATAGTAESEADQSEEEGEAERSAADGKPARDGLRRRRGRRGGRRRRGARGEVDGEARPVTEGDTAGNDETAVAAAAATHEAGADRHEAMSFLEPQPMAATEAEPMAEPEPVAEPLPEPEAASTAEPGPEPEPAAAPNGGDTTVAPEPEPASEPSPPAAGEPKGPPRRGWWQRMTAQGDNG